MLPRLLSVVGIVSFCLSTSLASAQKSAGTPADPKDEVGFLAGATLTASVATTLPDAPGAGQSSSIGFNASFALGIDYDYRLVNTRAGAIQVGADFLASPLDVITSSGPANGIDQYAYIFLVPEVRFKAKPIGPVSPFASAGGGYARFREGKLRNGAVNSLPGTNTGVGEFTVGVDSAKDIHLKLPVLGSIPIGARIEVRDYLSGQPNYQVPTAGTTQNNVALLGGFYIKL
jgi:hypothetical protein